MNMENEQALKPEAPVNVVGIVCDCNKLNIRKAPNKNSDVVEVVPVGTELTIGQHSLDKPWYRVTTATGVKGFCMREFVLISK